MTFTAAVTRSASRVRPIMNGEKGFTYLAVLMLVMVTSISMLAARTYWSTTMKREREEELLFRGDQIKKAIGSYCSASGGSPANYPPRLQDLLRDRRFPGLKKHLRKIYRDPMVPDGVWGLVLDGTGHVKGVFSKSSEEPLKKGNFPTEYSEFENKKKYSQWKFIYEPGKKGSNRSQGTAPAALAGI